MTDRPDLLLAGEIGKPHGIAGEVYVVRISDDPGRFSPGSKLTHEDGRSLVVESARDHRTRFLVKFETIGTREQAESLRGALFVEAAAARPLEADEYWPHELIGAEVVTAAGRDVGKVREILPGAAQDLMVVVRAGGDVLVPMVKDIIVEVDVAAGRVTIDPPEGLL